MLKKKKMVVLYFIYNISWIQIAQYIEQHIYTRFYMQSNVMILLNKNEGIKEC